jgi:undecaprenyl-diphosphatase
MGIFEAIILAIVEGITEIMPVSASGHLAIISNLLEVSNAPFTQDYARMLPIGVMLAILYSYWKRFTKIDSSHFYRKIVLAAAPSIVIFVLLSSYIESILLTTKAVAFTLIIGGIFFLFLDSVFRDSERSIKRMSRIGTPNAIAIGIWQILGLIPGIGRTAAAIIGGLQQGLTRTMAAEFGFFACVPIIFGISLFQLIKAMATNPSGLKDNAVTLVLGIGVSFIVSLITLRFMMQFIEKYGFKYFGWYRIVAGFVIFYLTTKGFLS